MSWTNIFRAINRTADGDALKLFREKEDDQEIILPIKRVL